MAVVQMAYLRTHTWRLKTDLHPMTRSGNTHNFIQVVSFLFRTGHIIASHKVAFYWL